MGRYCGNYQLVYPWYLEYIMYGIVKPDSKLVTCYEVTSGYCTDPIFV